MSFASILSEPAADIRTPTVAPSIPKNARKPSTSQRPSPTKVDSLKDASQKRETSIMTTYGTSDAGAGPFNTNGYTPNDPKPRRVLTARENEKVSKALALIDETDFSDVENPGFDAEEEKYIEKSKKRALAVDEVEARKRKVCEKQAVLESPRENH
jgi:DNA helicase INO80